MACSTNIAPRCRRVPKCAALVAFCAALMLGSFAAAAQEHRDRDHRDAAIQTITVIGATAAMTIRRRRWSTAAHTIRPRLSPTALA